MRLIPIYLISCISFAVCSVNCPQQAHGQVSHTINAAPSLQYAPGDPWTRGKLFNLQTKHFGFGYNCDDEECKRNSPYICWKNQTADDLPTRKGWWQRLSQTTAEIKQRIADGNCVQCAEADPCIGCQQQKCGGCCDGQCSNESPFVSTGAISPQTQAAEETLAFEAPIQTTAMRIENKQTIEQRQPSPIRPPTRTAGLESLDIRRQ